MSLVVFVFSTGGSVMMRVFGPISFLAFVGLIGLAQGKDTTELLQSGDHKHHKGHELLGNRISRDGQHHISGPNHNHGHNHNVHAHVGSGKIKRISAVHSQSNRSERIKKWKKTRNSREVTTLASNDVHCMMPGAESNQTVIVGFGFQVQFNGQWYWIIFWFPVEIVENGINKMDGTPCDEYPGNVDDI
jgi:hypothetical protein